MNPEERILLERSLKLSEENNKILKKFERRARWAVLWGILKIAIIIIPLVIGYFFIQPYIEQASDEYKDIREVFQEYRNLPF